MILVTRITYFVNVIKDTKWLVEKKKKKGVKNNLITDTRRFVTCCFFLVNISLRFDVIHISFYYIILYFFVRYICSSSYFFRHLFFQLFFFTNFSDSSFSSVSIRSKVFRPWVLTVLSPSNFQDNSIYVSSTLREMSGPA